MATSFTDITNNVHARSFAAGAATRYLGLDSIFYSFGAPPAVHWGLAGGIANTLSTQPAMFAMPVLDQTFAMCLASGFAGGVVIGYLM